MMKPSNLDSDAKPPENETKLPDPKIYALILAAGQSKRMGQPKMLLPWGETTVLGKVIEIIQRAEIVDLFVITGSMYEEVEAIARQYAVRCIFNEDYAHTEMLGSIQCGLRAIIRPPSSLRDTSPRDASRRGKSASNDTHERPAIVSGFGGGSEGALICLGDQPQIQERTVRLVCETFQKTKSNLVVPSFQMRRGHPWLVARPLWEELLMMEPPLSPRDFLHAHAREIEYVTVDTPTVVQDLDIPDDYLKFKP
jgi:molybdenum cofactor cytidylyltransferase